MKLQLSPLNLKLDVSPIWIPSSTTPISISSTLTPTPTPTPILTPKNTKSDQKANDKNQNILYNQSKGIQTKINCNKMVISPSASPISPKYRTIISAEEEFEEQHLVILDWDDTLFPTTYIRSISDNEFTDYLELQLFGKSLYDLLSRFIGIYKEENIYIITNASKEWVFKSLCDLSRKYQLLTADKALHINKMDYFAAIYNSFYTLNIGIISAFDLFNDSYPNQPLLWKINAFKLITREHFNTNHNNGKYNILSIGDSDDEFTASLEAKCMLKRDISNNYKNGNILLHRFKLMDDPSISVMINQMKYFINYLNIIYAANQAITMRFNYF